MKRLKARVPPFTNSRLTCRGSLPRVGTGALFALTAAILFAFTLPAQDRNVDDFFRDFTADWVRHDPELATRTRYFSGDEQDRLERQLTPLTVDWQRDQIRRARQGLSELGKFDHARMTETQRVSADVMRWQLDMVAREEPYLDYAFPLEQFNGANVSLVSALTITHPLLTERDAENYLAALGEVGARMGEAIAESRRLAAERILPPRFILQATIKQMRQFAAAPPAQNPFVTAFAQKMSGVKSISDAKREELRSGAEKIVSAQVYPAWKQAIALLESQSPQATDDAGLWRFKNGAEVYAYELQRYTTTNLTAEQIHELGLKQVQTLESQMDGLLRRLGRTEGSVKERIAKLREDMSYPNPTSEASRKSWRTSEEFSPMRRSAQPSCSTSSQKFR
jgi:uncharacterized protein (DUF885 family)